MFYENRPFSPSSASQILDGIPDIASVLLLDLHENVSVLATKHFFNGLLPAWSANSHPSWLFDSVKENE